MSDHIEVGTVCIGCDELWPCRTSLRTELAAAVARAAALEDERASALAIIDAPCGPECDSRYSAAPCSCWPDRLARARTVLAGQPAAPVDDEPWCTEDRHIVLPSGEACVCGENRMERLL